MPEANASRGHMAVRGSAGRGQLRCEGPWLCEGPLDEVDSIFNSTPNALEYRVEGRSREGNRVLRRR